jgi:hypothetical protein
MEDLAEKLRNLSLPSRSDESKCVTDSELDCMYAALMQSVEIGRKDLHPSFRKLRELATMRQKMDNLLVKIYESSLYYSLTNGDLSGFCLCANRLVGEIYDQCPDSENREDVTSLLLLYFALDVSRSADFASVFYKIPDHIRRCELVQYALDVYMALKRCDYSSWVYLMERATNNQLCILRVNMFYIHIYRMQMT